MGASDIVPTPMSGWDSYLVWHFILRDSELESSTLAALTAPGGLDVSPVDDTDQVCGLLGQE